MQKFSSHSKFWKNWGSYNWPCILFKITHAVFFAVKWRLVATSICFTGCEHFELGMIHPYPTHFQLPDISKSGMPVPDVWISGIARACHMWLSIPEQARHFRYPMLPYFGMIYKIVISFAKQALTCVQSACLPFLSGTISGKGRLFSCDSWFRDSVLKWG